MDEHKLADLFRDAVRDAPPASFDEGDVRTASARVTARRRTQLALGSTMAAVLLVGGTVVATSLLAGEKSANTTAAAGNTGVTQLDSQAERGNGSFAPKDLPGEEPTQGGSTPGSVGSQADTSAPQGCGTVDRKLADALAAELSVPAGQAVPVAANCPAGARGAAFPVDGGTVSAVLTPPGQNPSMKANSKTTEQLTASGQSLHVFAEPADSPSAERLDAIAGALIAQF